MTKPATPNPINPNANIQAAIASHIEEVAQALVWAGTPQEQIDAAIAECNRLNSEEPIRELFYASSGLTQFFSK